MRVHHVGYLVKDILDGKIEFEKLGYISGEIIRDEVRGIDICFVRNGEYCVELVSPFCKESIVSGLLTKMRNTPYHLCYISRDLEQDIQHLLEDGYVQIDEAKEAIAFDNRRVVFLMNSAIGLIEIVEEN